MRDNFYERFKAAEKMMYKSIAFGNKDWKHIEAYLLFLSSRQGYEVSVQQLIPKIVEKHISSDRNFCQSKNEWMCKIEEINAKKI